MSVYPSSNQTADVAHHQLNYLSIGISLSLLFPIWLTSVIGNALVLLCVIREKKLHRPSYYLIAALSMADICFPLFGFVPLFVANYVDTPLVCSARVQYWLKLAPTFLTNASSGILLTLTAERYCSIAYPIFHHSHVRNRRVVVVVMLEWLLSILMTIPFYPFSLPDGQDHQTYCTPVSFAMATMTSGLCIFDLAILSILNFAMLRRVRARQRDRQMIRMRVVQQPHGLRPMFCDRAGHSGNIRSSNASNDDLNDHASGNSATTNSNIIINNTNSQTNTNNTSNNANKATTTDTNKSNGNVNRFVFGAKMTKTIGTIVFFYVIFLLPTAVGLMLEAINFHTTIHSSLLLIVRRGAIFPVTANGALNPIIYARQNPHFRNGFRKILRLARGNRIDVDPSSGTGH